jgi:Rrf2 family cysteine metabolism transcriptional repressor
MKISTKGEYGIRAMLYIAMNSDRGPVTSHEIAKHQGIPEPYLRQILAQLSRDRLIHSNRGPQGGHVLARPAAQISIRDVLVTLEGQTTAIDQILALPCTIDVGPQHCAIREVFLEVKEAIDRILAATTLEDMSHRQREILRCNILIPSDSLPTPAPSPTARLLPVITE